VVIISSTFSTKSWSAALKRQRGCSMSPRSVLMGHRRQRSFRQTNIYAKRSRQILWQILPTAI